MPDRDVKIGKIGTATILLLNQEIFTGDATETFGAQAERGMGVPPIRIAREANRYRRRWA